MQVGKIEQIITAPHLSMLSPTTTVLPNWPCLLLVLSLSLALGQIFVES